MWPISNCSATCAPIATAEKVLDVTCDGHVDITDINAIINKMLNK